MANTHPANLGDVLKHLLLCEALAAHPSRYIESHGGAYSYDLAGADLGVGGVWDFAEGARRNATLGGSTYATIALPLCGRPAMPGSYLGSLALGDRILALGTPIIAAEHNPTTAAGLDDAMAVARRPFSRPASPSDGQDLGAEIAAPDDLVLTDPFDVMAASTQGTTSLDAFAAASKTGATVILWYPITEPDDDLPWMAGIEGRTLVPRERGTERVAGVLLAASSQRNPPACAFACQSYAIGRQPKPGP